MPSSLTLSSLSSPTVKVFEEFHDHTNETLQNIVALERGDVEKAYEDEEEQRRVTKASLVLREAQEAATEVQGLLNTDQGGAEGTMRGTMRGNHEGDHEGGYEGGGRD